ncbi:uncharacterized protein [Apostichopus japonicus]|uniref:uncharacterized protein n=1 Tax=Stichopus japonicus TaxID=307972 RepID=UPI003AB62153
MWSQEEVSNVLSFSCSFVNQYSLPPGVENEYKHKNDQYERIKNKSGFCVNMERYCLIIFLVFFSFTGFHGFNNSKSVRVVERDSVTLDCNNNATTGNKWFRNDKVIFANTFLFDLLPGFNLSNRYSLSISDATFNHQGLYRCERNNNVVVSYNVTIEVIPELTLSFHEHTFSEPRSTYDYVVIAGKPLQVKCRAVGSRPPASLTWIVNGEDVDPSNIHNVLYKPNKERINTTDSESTLHLPPTGTHVNISCQFKGIELVIQNLTINFIFFESSDKSEDGKDDNDHDWIIVTAIILGVIGLIVITFGCAVVLLKKDSQEFQISQAEYKNNATTSERRQSSIDSVGTTSKSLKRHSVARRKRKSPKDVNLILQLPGEGFITTWTAKSTVIPSNETQFVARTVKEQAKMTDLYNFQECAWFLSILEKNRHLVNFLGAAVDNVPYYIYQEYVDCGSVQDFLLMNYQSDYEANNAPSSQRTQKYEKIKTKRLILTSFVNDINKGMDFLHTKSYRHPALAARKVLLTEAGYCKLYDFWPEKLVPHRITQLINKKPRPVAWLAPETLFLEEYSDKSDVWSFGVVLWEICSLGETPYVGKTCDEIDALVRDNQSLTQPLSCPGGMYSLMLSCWNRNSKKRPTFKNILKQINTLSRCTTETTEDDQDYSDITSSPHYFTVEIQQRNKGLSTTEESKRPKDVRKKTQPGRKKTSFPQETERINDARRTNMSNADRKKTSFPEETERLNDTRRTKTGRKKNTNVREDVEI